MVESWAPRTAGETFVALLCTASTHEIVASLVLHVSLVQPGFETFAWTALTASAGPCVAPATAARRRADTPATASAPVSGRSLDKISPFPARSRAPSPIASLALALNHERLPQTRPPILCGIRSA